MSSRGIQPLPSYLADSCLHGAAQGQGLAEAEQGAGHHPHRQGAQAILTQRAQKAGGRRCETNAADRWWCVAYAARRTPLRQRRRCSSTSACSMCCSMLSSTRSSKPSLRHPPPRPPRLAQEKSCWPRQGHGKARPQSNNERPLTGVTRSLISVSSRLHGRPFQRSLAHPSSRLSVMLKFIELNICKPSGQP